MVLHTVCMDLEQEQNFAEPDVIHPELKKRHQIFQAGGKTPCPGDWFHAISRTTTPVRLRQHEVEIETTAPSVTTTGSARSSCKSNSDRLLLTKSGTKLMPSMTQATVILTAPTHYLEDAL